MMMVGRQFVRVGAPLEAALGDPLSGRFRGARDELRRGREIVGRDVERAQGRRHMHVDRVRQGFELLHQLPGDQQGDGVQGAADHALRRPVERAGVACRQNDDPRRAEFDGEA